MDAFADDTFGTFDIRAEVEAILKKVKAFTGPPQVGGNPETALELCYTIRGLTEAKRLATLLRNEFAIPAASAARGKRSNIQFAAVERCEDSPFQVLATPTRMRRWKIKIQEPEGQAQNRARA
jgi:hypothetical protein